jgi:putative membrane protein
MNQHFKIVKMKTKNFFRPLVLFLVVSSFSLVADAQKNNLSDPQVAHAAVTANQIDIAYADIAKQRSQNAAVIEFAATMQRDHAAVIQQAASLAKKLNVTPAPNRVSSQLLKNAERTKRNLMSLTGKKFDKAYINNEVIYHKAVISAVETVLIPETENIELKNLLQAVLPALRAHLAHAEMLQKNQK